MSVTVTFRPNVVPHSQGPPPLRRQRSLGSPEIALDSHCRTLELSSGARTLERRWITRSEAPRVPKPLKGQPNKLKKEKRESLVESLGEAL